jgi:hypothetical protein
MLFLAARNVFACESCFAAFTRKNIPGSVIPFEVGQVRWFQEKKFTKKILVGALEFAAFQEVLYY